MKARASETLRELGLPQTEVYRLDQVAAAAADEQFYLRWRTGSGRSNARERAEFIRENLDLFLDLAERGDLLTCERCYDTIVGGVSLIKPEFVYSEFVEGHSNSLLRRGSCGERFLVRNGCANSIRPIQKWHACQGASYVYRPIGLIDVGLASKTEEHLERLGCLPCQNLILEWMWTTAGFFFCDADRLSDSEFGDSIPDLWSGVDVVQIANAHGDVEALHGRTHVDALDCEYLPPAERGDTIVCINGAMLSHFVTRSIGRAVSVKWMKAEAFV